MVPPKILFFDLDDTLYQSESVYDEGLKRSWEVLCSTEPQFNNFPFEEFKKAYASARKRVKKILGSTPSSRSRLLYFKNMCDELFGVCKSTLILQMDRSYGSAYLEIDFSTTRMILESLSEKYKIGIITNQTLSSQLLKLSRLDPAGNLISYLITSEEAGVEKPNPKIFELAQEKTGFSAENCLMIGDDWENDIQGARSTGMNVIFLLPDGDHLSKDVPKIRKLEELLELLL